MIGVVIALGFGATVAAVLNLKQRNPYGTKDLEYGGPGNYPNCTFQGEQYNVLTLVIKKRLHSDVGDVTATIEYVHKGRSIEIVDSAIWFRKLFKDGQELWEKASRGSLALPGSHGVAFLFIDCKGRNMIPTHDSEQPLLEIGQGRWIARVTICGKRQPPKFEHSFAICDERRYIPDNPSFSLGHGFDCIP